MKAIVLALVCTGSAGFALHGAPFHTPARALSASSSGGEVDDACTGKSFSRRSFAFGTTAVGLSSIAFPGQAEALTVAERKRIVAEKVAKRLEDPNSAESKAAASKAARAAKDQERLAKKAVDKETALARKAASAEKQAAQRALWRRPGVLRVLRGRHHVGRPPRTAREPTEVARSPHPRAAEAATRERHRCAPEAATAAQAAADENLEGAAEDAAAPSDTDPSAA